MLRDKWIWSKLVKIGSCWDLFYSHQTVEILPSVVWASQSTPAQRIFAHFVRLSTGAKTQSVTLTDFFVAQTVTIGEQKISPKSDFFKIIFTDSDCSRPNSLRLPRPGSGSSISSKYVGMTRSLATRSVADRVPATSTQQYQAINTHAYFE